ncbi:(2Fe-2S)-binding protein [Streptomyces sp. ACA25]|uniref:(2Fe-2S)-binding protein n=1 Tax=Streptomyces sp. ACA25 TaxID=3022596 RepID=UPI002307F747|nr:(2Fe-2S)-binding protein [Streptomyces sp. ACA25]MDB1090349.1 (2Fe-2S)-binding protein [Streptomyces sp. ACA25]
MNLDALDALGGFFALRTDPPPSGRTVPLAQVYAGGDVQLHRRIAAVGERLGHPEPRVAASLAQLSLASRLWSVGLGAAVLHGTVPDLAPDRLHWDPDGQAPDDLWLPAPRPRPVPSDLPRLLADSILADHLLPLETAVRRVCPVAAGLLRGNAASALAGALRQLGQWCLRHGREDRAHRARHLTAALFHHPALRGTGSLNGTAFRRTSCCLYYRIPSGGVCGDCVFPRPPGGR